MYKIKLSPYAKIFYTEWLLDPDSFRYNLVIDQILHGELEVAKLRAALKRYIADNLVLNSHIQEINGEPYWVKNDQIVELEYSDSPIASDELFAYVSSGFDLYCGPLYRFKLIKIKDGTYRFIIIMHHLVIDGSSGDDGIFGLIPKYYNDENYVREYSIDRQIELLINLTETLTAKLKRNEAEHEKFWRKQLTAVDAIKLDFLQLKPKNFEIALDSKSNPIGEIRFNYDEVIADNLKQIKRRYIITPYIYSLCIFAVLLNRYTNQKHLAISYPVAIKEGLGGIYGAQVNTNLISYQFNQNTTIVDLFNQSKVFFSSLKNGNINHGYSPIMNILHGHDSHLLNISFTQTHIKDVPFIFDGITNVEIQAEFDINSVDTFIFEQSSKQYLSYVVRYNKKVVNEGLLKNFVNCYKRLFLEILEDLLVGNEGKQLSSYSLLDSEQYHKIVYEFNQTEKFYPKDKTIQQLFEEQVQKTPNNTAVVYGDRKLNYQELNNKANQLANYLLGNYAIKPDDLIALIVDRSEYMIIAILAVLKTGAAYVPISPDYPAERIKYILNDTKAKIALNDSCFKKSFFLN